ncbi:MAG: hypothetical protein ABII09_03220 [Planctomycetota bacterium]
MGVEPTNNGFANRKSKEDKPQQTQDLQPNEKSVLASCLALLREKYPDLAQIVEHWPNLSAKAKQSILAELE